jgi:sortase A
LIVVGVAVMAWSFVVWRWDDPVTSFYTRWQQGRLSDRYAAIVEKVAPKTVVPRTTSRAEAALKVANAAGTFRSSSREGDPIGRIIVPHLGLNAVVVNGTDTSSLRKGPGRDLRTYFPGQGKLVYIAGHRTTYAAPFSHIDRLVPGDRVTLEMPYGTFTYAVTGHSIVPADDLSVLTSHGREVVALQACHPRFFATERYIVWARPVAFMPRGGRTYPRP